MGDTGDYNSNFPCKPSIVLLLSTSPLLFSQSCLLFFLSFPIVALGTGFKRKRDLEDRQEEEVLAS